MNALCTLRRYRHTLQPPTPNKSKFFNVCHGLRCIIRIGVLGLLLGCSPAGLSKNAATTLPPAAAAKAKPIALLSSQIPAGVAERLAWNTEQSFDGNDMSTPVLVVNGALTGPTVCITAAVHGDEINGIEMVRRVLHGLDPASLRGAVIGVPIVNISGFRSSSRYLPDRRDLNRYFPGKPHGSLAARIAHSFFNNVVRHCDYLVDLHTGSFHRTNLTQIRADMKDPKIKKIAQSFGDIVILHSRGVKRSLRRAATEAGIPSVAIEAGEPLRLHHREVNLGVKGIKTFLSTLGMIETTGNKPSGKPIYYQSKWVRTDRGGILLTQVKLGANVRAGDKLGVVIDPVTNERSKLTTDHTGRVFGMALNQVVMPGYAAFRIGIEKSTARRRQPNAIKQRDRAGEFENGEE